MRSRDWGSARPLPSAPVRQVLRGPSDLAPRQVSVTDPWPLDLRDDLVESTAG